MNSLGRYFIDQEFVEGAKVNLAGEEAHHAARVRRVQEGQDIEVFNGRGSSAIVRVDQLSKTRLDGLVKSVLATPPPSLEVELCQAIPKGGNMEWVIQKSVELGVSSIQPLITDHTVARSDNLDKKLQKWQKIALEACKQCGQNSLPVIQPIRHFSDWIEKREEKDAALVAALDPRSKPIKQVLRELIPKTERISLIIGPEGDFSEPEYDTMAAKVMHFVSIGKIVLKVETAAFFCLSAVNYESD